MRIKEEKIKNTKKKHESLLDDGTRTQNRKVNFNVST